MAKILTKRFVLRKNGKLVKSYTTLGRACQGLESLYNKGDVLPYDSFTIVDSFCNLVIYNF